MGNDCRRILFGLFMASALSGCLQGNDIETVKEGRFDAYPEFKMSYCQIWCTGSGGVPV